jgi:hypothetical protein
MNNQHCNTRELTPIAPSFGSSSSGLDGSQPLVDNFVGNLRHRAHFSLVKPLPQAVAKNFSMKKSFPIKHLHRFALSHLAAHIAHSASPVFVEFSGKTQEKLC